MPILTRLIPKLTNTVNLCFMINTNKLVTHMLFL